MSKKVLIFVILALTSTGIILKMNSREYYAGGTYRRAFGDVEGLLKYFSKQPNVGRVTTWYATINAPRVAGLETLDARIPLLGKDYLDYMDRILEPVLRPLAEPQRNVIKGVSHTRSIGYHYDNHSGPGEMDDIKVLDLDLLKAANVTHIVSRELNEFFKSKSEKMELVGSHYDVHGPFVVFTLKDPVGRFLFKESSAQTKEILATSNAPDRITFEFETLDKGRLEIANAYHPRWMAYVNGQKTEIFKNNGMFQAIDIEKPGIQKIEFRFEDLKLKLIIIILMPISILILLAYMFWGFRQSSQPVECLSD